MQKINKLFRIFLFFSLILSLLVFPKQALVYALTGLSLWFEKMIPILLPFMIISGIMIRLGIHTSFIKIFRPILKPIFRLNDDCLYTIFMGFLCGFPMGAKTCFQLYQLKKIKKEEAEYLLAFCNNIGPVYFLGFVLPLVYVTEKIPYLIGMYGIPILYGIFLRYTSYREQLADTKHKKQENDSEIRDFYSVFEAIDDSIMNALRQIAMLGGYMIIFNVLNILPFLWQLKNPFLLGVFHCMFEITGGISILGAMARNDSAVLFFVFTLLSFGGFSCMAQTFSIFKESDISLSNYLIHKIILCILTGIYYFFLLC